eukprot:2714968-Prymnesium_polylepis.1
MTLAFTFILSALAPRAPPSAASPGSASGAICLHLADGTLSLADGTALLEDVASVLRPSPSASGGVFLHAEFDSASAAHDVRLGALCAFRLLGCARTTRYWMAPRFCSSAAELPLETQFVLVECAPGGPYALFLPLVDGATRASIGTAAKPSLLARLFQRPDARRRALWAHSEAMPPLEPHSAGPQRCRSH